MSVNSRFSRILSILGGNLSPGVELASIKIAIVVICIEAYKIDRDLKEF